MQTPVAPSTSRIGRSAAGLALVVLATGLGCGSDGGGDGGSASADTPRDMATALTDAGFDCEGAFPRDVEEELAPGLTQELECEIDMAGSLSADLVVQFFADDDAFEQQQSSAIVLACDDSANEMPYVIGDGVFVYVDGGEGMEANAERLEQATAATGGDVEAIDCNTNDPVPLDG